VSGDLTQLGIGAFFLTWLWFFPIWLDSVRRRMGQRGRRAYFNAHFPSELIIFGRYGVPLLGVILIINGLIGVIT